MDGLSELGGGTSRSKLASKMGNAPSKLPIPIWQNHESLSFEVGFHPT